MAILTVSGYVGNVDFKYSESGTAILILSIADKRWNYKTKEEETFWIRSVWFGERAEKLENSLTKAKVIMVTGLEAYKIYDGKIDRSIEPLEHSILQFKSDDGNVNGNGNKNINNDNYPPPPSENDIPYFK